ncbi:MAG: hypothetical protein C0467_06095 [Planctomycetaceae bacterium]|nr:hypothetical protein [Planctomycetaceae bacterium]
MREANLAEVRLNLDGNDLIYETPGDVERGNPLDIVTVAEAHSATDVTGLRFKAKDVAKRLQLTWNTYSDLLAERDKLLAFKQYVHARLDVAGVSVDPESPHKAEGCRVGGRLDEVIDERDRLRVIVSRLNKRLLRATVTAAAEDPVKADARRENFIRAGGGVVCGDCGLAYSDHPQDPKDEFLNILCDRTRVKL